MHPLCTLLQTNYIHTSCHIVNINVLKCSAKHRVVTITQLKFCSFIFLSSSAIATFKARLDHHTNFFQWMPYLWTDQSCQWRTYNAFQGISLHTRAHGDGRISTPGLVSITGMEKKHLVHHLTYQVTQKCKCHCRTVPSYRFGIPNQVASRNCNGLHDSSFHSSTGFKQYNCTNWCKRLSTMKATYMLLYICMSHDLYLYYYFAYYVHIKFQNWTNLHGV